VHVCIGKVVLKKIRDKTEVFKPWCFHKMEKIQFLLNISVITRKCSTKLNTIFKSADALIFKASLAVFGVLFELCEVGCVVLKEEARVGLLFVCLLHVYSGSYFPTRYTRIQFHPSTLTTSLM
jgi:hypothetical protein